MDISATKRVLVVDADPLTRLGLTAVVNLHPLLRVCGEASDARAASQLCAEHLPDVLIADLVLPNGDGLELLSYFTSLQPHSRSVVVSHVSDAFSVRRAFRAGASGYVTKQEEPAQILCALESAMQGTTFVSKRISAILLAEVGTKSAHKVFDSLDTLSNRELHIFRRLGNKQGATAMARDLGISIKTIETHLRRIKEKLRLRGSEQLHALAQRWIVSLESGRTAEKL